MIRVISQISYGRIYLVHEKKQKENRNCYQKKNKIKNKRKTFFSIIQKYQDERE